MSEQLKINKLAIETYYEANNMMASGRFFIGTLNHESLDDVKYFRMYTAEKLLQELTIDDAREIIRGVCYLYSLGEKLVKEGREF